MATQTSTPPDAAAAPTPSGKRLFAYRATKDDRMVVELHCYQHDSAEVVVEALVLSVRAPEDAEPVRQRHSFPTREPARHFVDEALITLEYAGCIVADLGS
jgi:hypothetical protein